MVYRPAAYVLIVLCHVLLGKGQRRPAGPVASELRVTRAAQSPRVNVLSASTKWTMREKQTCLPYTDVVMHISDSGCARANATFGLHPESAPNPNPGSARPGYRTPCDR